MHLKRIILYIILSILSVNTYGEDVLVCCTSNESVQVLEVGESVLDILEITNKIHSMGIDESNQALLLNLINLSSGLMTSSYIFDQDAVENALYKFVMDFKRASKNHKFSDEDIVEFFLQSNLSQVLAESIVAKGVEDLILDTFLGDNRFIDNDSGVSEIAEMFKDPEYLRIFVSSAEGKRLINHVKTSVLVPTVTDSKVQDDEYFNRAVAVTAFTDLKDFGIMDRFTEVYYENTLNKQFENYKRRVFLSSITAGHINGLNVLRKPEYDWEKLKQTESGRKAISMYGSKIVAQALAGNDITDDEIKKARKKLEDLLDDAQDEVDDE